MNENYCIPFMGYGMANRDENKFFLNRIRFDYINFAIFRRKKFFRNYGSFLIYIIISNLFLDYFIT